MKSVGHASVMLLGDGKKKSERLSEGKSKKPVVGLLVRSMLGIADGIGVESPSGNTALGTAVAKDVGGELWDSLAPRIAIGTIEIGADQEGSREDESRVSSSCVGDELGAREVGTSVGFNIVGASEVGACVGDEVGAREVGASVGFNVVGASDVGACVGDELGTREVGANAVGLNVAGTGAFVGIPVGSKVGSEVTAALAEGLGVGDNAGFTVEREGTTELAIDGTTLGSCVVALNVGTAEGTNNVGGADVGD